jgi:hypothetical protein
MVKLELLLFDILDIELEALSIEEVTSDVIFLLA